MNPYIPVLVMGALALVVGCVVAYGPGLLGPKRPSRLKQSAYECGMEPISKLGRRLPVRYSLVAILFLLFDVELVFLFPWAAWWGSLGEGGTEQALRVLGFVEVSIFLGFLTVGYIYIWRRGGLEWD